MMNCPRANVRSRQGQAIVTRAATNGSPLTSVLVAHATQQSAGFRIWKCVSKRCITGPKFIVNKPLYPMQPKKVCYY